MISMKKISVAVTVPALGNIYDFIVPDSLSVAHVQQLMARILCSEYGVQQGAEELSLFDKADGTVLRQECSFRQLGITDGAQLVLM